MSESSGNDTDFLGFGDSSVEKGTEKVNQCNKEIVELELLNKMSADRVQLDELESRELEMVGTPLCNSTQTHNDIVNTDTQNNTNTNDGGTSQIMETQINTKILQQICNFIETKLNQQTVQINQQMVQINESLTQRTKQTETLRVLTESISKKMDTLENRVTLCENNLVDVKNKADENLSALDKKLTKKLEELERDSNEKIQHTHLVIDKLSKVREEIETKHDNKHVELDDKIVELEQKMKEGVQGVCNKLNDLENNLELAKATNVHVCNNGEELTKKCMEIGYVTSLTTAETVECNGRISFGRKVSNMSNKVKSKKPMLRKRGSRNVRGRVNSGNQKLLVDNKPTVKRMNNHDGMRNYHGGGMNPNCIFDRGKVNKKVISSKVSRNKAKIKSFELKYDGNRHKVKMKL